MTEIAYGYRVKSFDDEIVALADKATTETVRAGSPGSDVLAILVDFFPIRMYFTLLTTFRLTDVHFMFASEALPIVDAGIRIQSQDE